jgi:hypothetical protein
MNLLLLRDGERVLQLLEQGVQQLVLALVWVSLAERNLRLHWMKLKKYQCLPEA